MAIRTAAAASVSSGASAGSRRSSSGCARGLGTRPTRPRNTATRTEALDASKARLPARAGCGGSMSIALEEVMIDGDQTQRRVKWTSQVKRPEQPRISTGNVSVCAFG